MTLTLPLVKDGRQSTLREERNHCRGWATRNM